MSKREHRESLGGTEGSRTKRRRHDVSSSDVDITMSDPVAEEEEEEEEEEKDEVKEQGLKLWQTVKDAVNKEGRSISLDFLRKPPKRQYPDYYQLIQQPIALEDIKKQLDSGGYQTLESVKQAFELCFNNAKQYNMKESGIWRDAKDLLKLVHKTYAKMVPPTENEENAGGEDGKKKSKPHNFNRLIKLRLQKLVDKTDDSGRVIATEFMDLPSKKEWPIYYKEIKRPQCLENIFKRIKRKEYTTSADFADDVELVFSNAMAFNQDHTPIWEDALLLRDTFRQLMADLPPPFSLPQYSKPANNKIKIRMPGTAQPSAPATVAAPVASVSLRVPAPAPKSIKASSSTPVLANASLPPTGGVSVHVAPPAAAPRVIHQNQLPSSSSTPQPTTQLPSYGTATFAHYPNAAYIPPAASSSSIPTIPVSASTSLINATSQPYSASQSPAPPLHPSHQLRYVSIRTEPRGRPLNLDYRDGVKSWAMRLGAGEVGIWVKDVIFLEDEEDDSSGGEEEEEAEGEDEGLDAPVKTGRRKGKGKGRGRQKTKAAKPKTTGLAKKKAPKLEEVQVKLNGVVILEREDSVGRWLVDVPIGSNTIEVGEKGGLIWRIYADRMT